jgi:uncharacterized protein YdgA (DUF945 family)
MAETYAEKDVSYLDFTDLDSLMHSLALNEYSEQEIIILLSEAISHDGYETDEIIIDAGLLPELEAIKAAIANNEYPNITEEVISEYKANLKPEEL